SEHVERTWCLGQRKLERRQVFGKGDCIVHQGCAEHPPTHIIGHLFIESLADALSNGPMGLTLYQRRDKDMTVIIYRHIALELHVAGLRVYLDDSQMCAKRIR